MERTISERTYWRYLKVGKIWGVRPDGSALAKETAFDPTNGLDSRVYKVTMTPPTTPPSSLNTPSIHLKMGDPTGAMKWRGAYKGPKSGFFNAIRVPGGGGRDYDE